jgi:hypothetical protein
MAAQIRSASKPHIAVGRAKTHYGNAVAEYRVMAHQTVDIDHAVIPEPRVRGYVTERLHYIAATHFAVLGDYGCRMDDVFPCDESFQVTRDLSLDFRVRYRDYRVNLTFTGQLPEFCVSSENGYSVEKASAQFVIVVREAGQAVRGRFLVDGIDDVRDFAAQTSRAYYIKLL